MWVKSLAGNQCYLAMDFLEMHRYYNDASRSDYNLEGGAANLCVGVKPWMTDGHIARRLCWHASPPVTVCFKSNSVT